VIDNLSAGPLHSLSSQWRACLYRVDVLGRRMKFGLFYQLQVPRPWHARSEYEVYRQAIDQVAFAEQEGFESAWVAEHHFLEEVSHAAASDMILAAMAEHTSTMRLGYGVALMSSPLNHPLRVAERVATLDILSNGRVELGTGRSTTSYQLSPFGIDLADTRGMWEESIEIIPRMWTEERFEHKGPYFNIPPRNVLPKPLQKPHPPMWVACTQPETATVAGEKGLGGLFMSSSGPARTKERIDLYRDALKTAKPVGAEVNSKVGIFIFSFCASDDAAARSIGGPEALWYRQSLAAIFNQEWDRLASVPDSYKYHAGSRTRFDADNAADYNKLIDSGTFCMGDPDACIKTLEEYAALDPDEVVLIMQAGRIPHDKIMESIRLFGREIIPEFKRREKAKLAGATPPVSPA